MAPATPQPESRVRQRASHRRISRKAHRATQTPLPRAGMTVGRSSRWRASLPGPRTGTLPPCNCRCLGTQHRFGPRWSCGRRDLTTRTLSQASRPSAKSDHRLSAGRGSTRLVRLVTFVSGCKSSGPSRRGTVPAHLFAFQLAHGVIAGLAGPQPRILSCATPVISTVASAQPI